ncbi:Uncharacterised protein [Stutzerimonas stutzeri]|nr:Uncharacterised protein [Stutzerimonas stutzeri]CAB5537393.1 Uncharacterised protein [Stutzerimonas stutzeri]CAC9076292.1 Uncharacterised protein [Stutzerimonas stutzeri]
MPETKSDANGQSCWQAAQQKTTQHHRIDRPGVVMNRNTASFGDRCEEQVGGYRYARRITEKQNQQRGHQRPAAYARHPNKYANAEPGKYQRIKHTTLPPAAIQQVTRISIVGSSLI